LFAHQQSTYPGKRRNLRARTLRLPASSFALTDPSAVLDRLAWIPHLHLESLCPLRVDGPFNRLKDADRAFSILRKTLFTVKH